MQKILFQTFKLKIQKVAKVANELRENRCLTGKNRQSESIWTDILSFCKEAPVLPVYRGLRVNVRGIYTRCKRAVICGFRRTRVCGRRSAKFLELPNTMPVSSANTNTLLTAGAIGVTSFLEFERMDGMKLRVSTSAAQGISLTEVIRNFVGTEQ